MAKHLDALAVIFPFEVKSYADTSLPVEFVGHPFVADDYESPVSYDGAGPVLLLPGSRRQSVARIFPAVLAVMPSSPGPPDRAAVVLYPSEEIRISLTIFCRGLRRIRGAGQASANRGGGRSSRGSHQLRDHVDAVRPGGNPWGDHLPHQSGDVCAGRWLVKVPYIGIANLLFGRGDVSGVHPRRRHFGPSGRGTCRVRRRSATPPPQCRPGPTAWRHPAPAGFRHRSRLAGAVAAAAIEVVSSEWRAVSRNPGQGIGRCGDGAPPCRHGRIVEGGPPCPPLLAAAS